MGIVPVATPFPRELAEQGAAIPEKPGDLFLDTDWLEPTFSGSHSQDPFLIGRTHLVLALLL